MLISPPRWIKVVFIHPKSSCLMYFQMRRILCSHCVLFGNKSMLLNEERDEFKTSLEDHCNVPDPPTDEEDATDILSTWETSPMNIK